ncbi:hypothetical protein P5673_029931 [Acropora cervicornis]|uniref:MADF domain-containing protein n=1 Tax=Acropora cervicornis TaxID=6130 RepID=A0AAD9PVB4_ACRCE|nr:hypothetical protein P5673_029931 [Acropora cervicornis]
MATAKSVKQKSPQKSRGISWKNENVQLLLEVMKEETILFRLQVNVDSVINKWKKLGQQYKTHLHNQKQSGTERGKKWKFFDEMNEICGHRVTSTPVTVTDSSLQNNSGDSGEFED